MKKEKEKELRDKIKEVPNRVGVLVRYEGPTNFDGARILLSLPRVNNDRNETPVAVIPYDYAANDITEGAAFFIAENLGLLPIAKSHALETSGGCDLLVYEWYEDHGREERPGNNYSAIRELLEKHSEDPEVRALAPHRADHLGG